MMVIHARQGGRMVELTSADALRSIPVPDVVWIDLEGPTELEVKATETFIGTELMTPTEAAEIESSSSYFEEPPAEFHLNTHFLQPGEHGWRPEPVTFAMRNQVLVTRRSGPLHSFTELARRRKLSAHAEWTGYDTFLSLFDLRIDEDADLVEQLSRDIIVLNKDLNLNTTVGKDLLLRIDELLDKAMVLRANIVDKQRTLSAVLKSEGFPTDHTTAYIPCSRTSTPAGTHHLRLRAHGVSAEHGTGPGEHRPEQGDQDLHRGHAHLHAAHAHRQHLRNELPPHARAAP
ncbi:MAG: hypothetical protein IPI07_16015 [Flavobacteriales bacterium]|nr:hypothetical protein [Flavobacteriales bacterium]